MPGRWKTTRFQIGDKVRYYGHVYEVYRIDWVLGPDRHLKPMYAIRHQWKKYTNSHSQPGRGKWTKGEMKAWSSGSRLTRA